MRPNFSREREDLWSRTNPPLSSWTLTQDVCAGGYRKSAAHCGKMDCLGRVTAFDGHKPELIVPDFKRSVSGMATPPDASARLRVSGSRGAATCALSARHVDFRVDGVASNP